MRKRIVLSVFLGATLLGPLDSPAASESPNCRRIFAQTVGPEGGDLRNLYAEVGHHIADVASVRVLADALQDAGGRVNGARAAAIRLALQLERETGAQEGFNDAKGTFDRFTPRAIREHRRGEELNRLRRRARWWPSSAEERTVESVHFAKGVPFGLRLYGSDRLWYVYWGNTRIFEHWSPLDHPELRRPGRANSFFWDDVGPMLARMPTVSVVRDPQALNEDVRLFGFPFMMRAAAFGHPGAQRALDRFPPSVRASEWTHSFRSW